jgi:hypothetical protein
MAHLLRAAVEKRVSNEDVHTVPFLKNLLKIIYSSLVSWVWGKEHQVRDSIHMTNSVLLVVIAQSMCAEKKNQQKR